MSVARGQAREVDADRIPVGGGLASREGAGTGGGVHRGPGSGRR